MRAGSCCAIRRNASSNWASTASFASTPPREAKPEASRGTDTVSVGPPAAGSTASSTAVPTTYPRRMTSKSKSGASSRTLLLPAPCHWGQTSRRITSESDEAGDVMVNPPPPVEWALPGPRV